MGRIEKTVFISYRRNTPWFARAVFQSLTHHGYDVFLDYNGLASGDFERVILENIRARAHFLVLLTPSALKRCSEPGDWLRREIETALESKRNIVSLTQEDFKFNSAAVKRQLTGSLALLKHYNALAVPAEYFDAAMEKLREKFLNVSLDMIIHPLDPSSVQAAKEEQAAATVAPTVTEKELTAEEWFERGFNTTDPGEQVRFYSNAIQLNPRFAEALYNRGVVRLEDGDLDGAIGDFYEAIRLNPSLAEAFNNRGTARSQKGDLDAARQDYDEAIRLNPTNTNAFYNRGVNRLRSGDPEGAIQDFDAAIQLNPNRANAFNDRGSAQYAKENLDLALQDYNEAIRIDPRYANAFYNRALLWDKRGQFAAAIADFNRYLKLGGGQRDGDTETVKQAIRDLQKQLSKP